ncbi:uncharacterized protein CXorf65 homolog [Ambystoma mexicanum]|uniref:uncharacterized protein CXorf65 homolog n=1 Tax=Ambystoma mexicanum TaxID=8296 RepID=UPI0037E7CC51
MSCTDLEDDEEQETSGEYVPSPSTIIYIKHGENEEFMVNINSAVLHILDYVKIKLGLPKEDTVDLCDVNGSLKLLFLVKLPFDSATKLLLPQESYYICRVLRGDAGPGQEKSFRLIQPMLTTPSQQLLDTLQGQCAYLEKIRLRMLKQKDSKKLLMSDSMTVSTPTVSPHGRRTSGRASAEEEKPQKKDAKSVKSKTSDLGKRERHR